MNELPVYAAFIILAIVLCSIVSIFLPIYMASEHSYAPIMFVVMVIGLPGTIVGCGIVLILLFMQYLDDKNWWNRFTSIRDFKQ
ncbi:hypothetical protein VPHF86_0135 [Vibrio phage F86]